jgi:hypothetical protein
MGLLLSYRLRLRRKRSHLRANIHKRDLVPVNDRSPKINRHDILLFSTLRNEKPRLPFFLRYYRELGIDHFLIVDNGSTDGSREYLAQQPDVSLWSTQASYREAHFGVDWLNALQRRHGHGHWTLVVDPDEFLVYPFCDSRPLRALTDWLESSATRSFGAMLVDMYPKGPITAQPYREGQDPLEIASYFDAGNYMITPNKKFGNLWIQGGPRARCFFASQPKAAPALNKIPLVRWERRYAYDSSTHVLLPRGLNRVYDTQGGERASGCLLHAKFLNLISAKTEEELTRAQHYAGGREYAAYHRAMARPRDLWCSRSEKYVNWRQLEILGLLSKGSWA